MEPWKYNDNSSNEYESSIDNQSEASEKVSIDIGHFFSINPNTFYNFNLPNNNFWDLSLGRF